MGRADNFVFFVSQTAPNEKIIAEITQIKKNFGLAKLVEILEPSPARRPARCPVVNDCGGCVWQHVSYSEQLKQKRTFIQHYLKPLLPDINALPTVVPATDEYNYRNRVQVHVQKASSTSMNIGFFKQGSNTLVPIKDCLIAAHPLFHDLHKEPQLQELTPKYGFYKFELALVDGSRVLRNLSETESEFAQVNSTMNSEMVRYILAEVAQRSPSKINNIHDLYCGDGNITKPLAEAYPETLVIGVEQCAPAIQRASRNVAKNIQYQAQDVLSYLQKHISKPNSVYVLDPARAGLGTKTCTELIRLQPALIVYVSCSLPSLARDLQQLCQEGYRVVSLCGFDMFPQTDYVEAVVTLLPRAIQDFC